MNNLQLVQEADTLLNSKKQGVLLGEQIIIEPLYQNRLLTSHLIGRRAIQASQESAVDRVQLLKLMDKHFNKDDLQTAMFSLNIDYEAIPGDTKMATIRELILYMQRKTRLVELLTYCQTEHAHVTWPSISKTKPDELVPRIDTAVVVDIARPAMHNTAQFLDEEEIEANFVLLRHAENRFLNEDDDWSQMIQGFATAMNHLSRRIVGGRTHFFLAGPGAVLFGMGCIWGTVDEAAVYHYEKGTYQYAFEVSRALRG